MSDWPNFFIVGAPKCGTSSVFAYLSQIDGIFMSPVKEPNFFSTTIVPEDGTAHPLRDKAAYLQLFSQAGSSTIRGEASTTYLLDPGAASGIARHCPDAKIVVMLRDPVDLAFSFWLMLLRSNDSCAPFLDEVRNKLAKRETDWYADDLKLEFGFFAESLQRYYETFTRENVHVVIFEEFTADPEATVIELAKFLGVDYEPGKIAMRVYNQHGEPRGPWAKHILGNKQILHIAEKLTPPTFRNWIRRTFLLKKSQKPMMDDEAETLLVDLYREDVKRVEDMLQRELPWRGCALD